MKRSSFLLFGFLFCFLTQNLIGNFLLVKLQEGLGQDKDFGICECGKPCKVNSLGGPRTNLDGGMAGTCQADGVTCLVTREMPVCREGNGRGYRTIDWYPWWGRRSLVLPENEDKEGNNRNDKEVPAGFRTIDWYPWWNR